MNIPLSKRLQQCCNFVQSGTRVADIGCDHGYLSIYLLYHGIASHVIAADINPMPLQSAIANAEKLLCNNIDTIAKDKRIHPYFKLSLIDEYLSLLVKTLKKNSSTYLNWQQEIKTLREEFGDKVKWQMTGSDIDITALNRRIADCCNKYSNYLPYITIDRQIEALELIKKRKLTPAGFVFFNEDNTSWKFYRFAEAPAAGEFWIFRDNKFSIHGEYSGETARVSTLKSNNRIMLVFTPADGKSTAKIQQFMENQGTTLPESWPVFAF